MDIFKIFLNNAVTTFLGGLKLAKKTHHIVVTRQNDKKHGSSNHEKEVYLES
jgi:hypothetical protein